MHPSFRAFLSCVALAAFLQVIPAFAEAPRTIAIEIDGKAEFDVVYHRARTNATGAVIAGLVGAGIQAGIEADQDARKRDALYPYVAEQAWRDVFIKTMTDTLAAKGLEPVAAEVSMVPATRVPCSEEQAIAALKLIDALEDLDDVQNVYSNGDFPDSVFDV